MKGKCCRITFHFHIYSGNEDVFIRNCRYIINVTTDKTRKSRSLFSLVVCVVLLIFLIILCFTGEIFLSPNDEILYMKDTISDNYGLNNKLLMSI